MIIRGQFSTVTFVSYLLLMRLLLVVGVLVGDAEASTVSCVVHWLDFVVDCGTFCLEEVGSVSSLVLVHELNPRQP